MTNELIYNGIMSVSTALSIVQYFRNLQGAPFEVM